MRGFKVFIDIEGLDAGKFSINLLESIRAAKNFLIILSPNALDKCMNDDETKDWVHKVRLQFFSYKKQSLHHILNIVLAIKYGQAQTGRFEGPRHRLFGGP